MKAWCDWQIAPVQKSLVAPLEAMGAAQELDMGLTCLVLWWYIYVVVRFSIVGRISWFGMVLHFASKFRES